MNSRPFNLLLVLFFFQAQVLADCRPDVLTVFHEGPDKTLSSCVVDSVATEYSRSICPKLARTCCRDTILKIMMIAFDNISHDMLKLGENTLNFFNHFDSEDAQTNFLYAFDPSKIAKECMDVHEFNFARTKKFPINAWNQLYLLNKQSVASFFCALCNPANGAFFKKGGNKDDVKVMSLKSLDIYLDIIATVADILEYADSKQEAFEAIKCSEDPQHKPFKALTAGKNLRENLEKIKAKKDLVLSPLNELSKEILDSVLWVFDVPRGVSSSLLNNRFVELNNMISNYAGTFKKADIAHFDYSPIELQKNVPPLESRKVVFEKNLGIDLASNLISLEYWKKKKLDV